MRKRVLLQTAVLLSAVVNLSYVGASCWPPVEGQTPRDVLKCLQSELDTQQKRIAVLEKENQRLRSLSPTTENCTTAQQGQIRFDGTYARLCNGKSWQIIESRQPKPVMMRSANKYTMVEMINLLGSKYGAPEGQGVGSICEKGYHICTFMEGLVLKHAYPRSRGHDEEPYVMLRTFGTPATDSRRGAGVGTSHPHNSLLGFGMHNKEGGLYARIQCPAGSGPALFLDGKTRRDRGIRVHYGCISDAKQYWACCLNNLD